jgi:hypothetical protein
MRDYKNKYPGLSDEQARIRQKIWEREREREKQLLESIKKRLPFRSKEDEDTGFWDEVIYNNNNVDYGGGGFRGIVSDAALNGSIITFHYDSGDIKGSTSDSSGIFYVPLDFRSGDIIAKGGIDTVTGLPFNGEFVVDGEFFLKYRAITPLTHITNYIWNNTDTKTPEEALDLVLNHISSFIGINVNSLEKDRMFNNDHVRLTLKGLEGAKEVQAINTILEVYSDIIGNTEANLRNEISGKKSKFYSEISKGLLTKINEKHDMVYKESVFDLHELAIQENHKECCNDLIIKVSSLIQKALEKDILEATSDIQAINLAVKTEWAEKAFTMTQSKSIDKDQVWCEIFNKTPENLISVLNLTIV